MTKPDCCPFCGSLPTFSRAEWKDENRYVGMTLECCVTMDASIGWMRARNMTPAQHEAELKDHLTKMWNKRSGDHQFSISTVEKVRMACARMGVATDESLEMASVRLEDHTLALCRSIENWYTNLKDNRT